MVAMHAGFKALRAGNGWFVAAAAVSLVLAGLFTWARSVLAEDLAIDRGDQVHQDASEGPASPTPAQASATTRNVEVEKLRRVLSSGLRVGQFGSWMIFLLIAIGYVRRTRAIHAHDRRVNNPGPGT